MTFEDVNREMEKYDMGPGKHLQLERAGEDMILIGLYIDAPHAHRAINTGEQTVASVQTRHLPSMTPAGVREAIETAWMTAYKHEMEEWMLYEGEPCYLPHAFPRKEVTTEEGYTENRARVLQHRKEEAMFARNRSWRGKLDRLVKRIYLWGYPDNRMVLQSTSSGVVLAVKESNYVGDPLDGYTTNLEVIDPPSYNGFRQFIKGTGD